MLEEILKTYENDHALPNNANAPEKALFPQYLHLTDKNIIDALKKLKTNKAHSYDGFNNACFRLNNYENPTEEDQKIINFLKRAINEKDFLNSDASNFLFRGRAILLNKKFPSIGGSKDFRPIICLSSFVQFLYALLVDDLNFYQRFKMAPELTGFIPTQETSSNVRDSTILTKKFLDINKARPDSQNYVAILFLDFSSAFEKCLRTEIYKIITEKKILSNDKIQLLKFINEKMTVRIGKFSTKN